MWSGKDWKQLSFLLTSTKKRMPACPTKKCCELLLGSWSEHSFYSFGRIQLITISSSCLLASNENNVAWWRGVSLCITCFCMSIVSGIHQGLLTELSFQVWHGNNKLTFSPTAFHGNWLIPLTECYYSLRYAYRR